MKCTQCFHLGTEAVFAALVQDHGSKYKLADFVANIVPIVIIKNIWSIMF